MISRISRWDGYMSVRGVIAVLQKWYHCVGNHWFAESPLGGLGVGIKYKSAKFWAYRAWRLISGSMTSSLWQMTERLKDLRIQRKVMKRRNLFEFSGLASHENTKFIYWVPFWVPLHIRCKIIYGRYIHTGPPTLLSNIYPVQIIVQLPAIY